MGLDTQMHLESPVRCPGVASGVCCRSSLVAGDEGGGMWKATNES